MKEINLKDSASFAWYLWFGNYFKNKKDTNQKKPVVIMKPKEVMDKYKEKQMEQFVNKLTFKEKVLMTLNVRSGVTSLIFDILKATSFMFIKQRDNSEALIKRVAYISKSKFGRYALKETTKSIKVYGIRKSRSLYFKWAYERLEKDRSFNMVSEHKVKEALSAYKNKASIWDIEAKMEKTFPDEDTEVLIDIPGPLLVVDFNGSNISTASVNNFNIQLTCPPCTKFYDRGFDFSRAILKTTVKHKKKTTATIYVLRNKQQKRLS